MSQPKWRRIANLGDVNPINYGGFFVYIDLTGVYAPEAEVLITNEVAGDCDSWTIYRFILEPCTYTVDSGYEGGGVLSDNPYHPMYAVWFADKLESIAETMGTAREELIKLFCSDKAIDRAEAWRMVGDYFGYDNLDQYPWTCTRRADLPRRIRRI